MSTLKTQPLTRGLVSPIPFNELAVGLAVLVSASLSIALTRVPGGIALFAPATAIGAALLIRMQEVRWSLALGCIIIAFMLANNLVAHRPWAEAALFTAVNVVEITLMVAAFRFVRPLPYPDITIVQAALMTAVFGIAIPLCRGGSPRH